MSEIINSLESIIKTIAPNSSNVFARVVAILFTILTLGFLDYWYGFSQSYYNEQKIDQIAKIRAVLKDNTLDSSTRVILETMQNKILNHQHIYDRYNLDISFYDDSLLNNTYFILLYLIPIGMTILSLGIALTSIRSKEFPNIFLGVFMVIILAWVSAFTFDLILTLIPLVGNILIIVKMASILLFYYFIIKRIIKENKKIQGKQTTDNLSL